MRRILTLCLLAFSLSLSAARVRQRTDIAPSAIADFAQTRESPDNGRRIERLQIRNQTGLDGKVRRIRLHLDEDGPGVRAYGLPKKRPQDNGVIERASGTDGKRIDVASRLGRLVEAYGMPKDRVETNGFIERLPMAATAERQPAGLRNEEMVRSRRSVREGSENKLGERIASEAEDMVAQDSKVFRPLFVYRQQVAARERRRKHAKKLAHGDHRHASRESSCDHRRARFY